MAATAAAVAPVAFAVRPTTAEAAVINCFGFRCNPAAYCCDGWTEFCCRITGENTCPPGTVVAGWWKVDDSDFCSIDEPRPRYYIDCNLECDPACRCDHRGTCGRSCTSARCRCPDGCGTRKSECLRFRYGQCNQDVCVGPISCRVVTCVAPWQWDEGCGTAPVLRSESTRWHDLPCLHEGFNDVPPKAHYADAVRWMADEGIAEGLTHDLFGPDDPVTRAHFATFLWRYSGEPLPAARESDDMPASLSFDDVPAGSPYEHAVAWMVEAGITAGISARKFGPDEGANRTQAVVFLHRLAGSPSPLGPSPAPQSEAVPAEGSSPALPDDQASTAGGTDTESSVATLVSPSTDQPEVSEGEPLAVTDQREWYADALEWAVGRDIVWWYPDLPFDGDQPVSRSEAAALLYRYHLSGSVDQSPETEHDQDAAEDPPGDEPPGGLE